MDFSRVTADFSRQGFVGRRVVFDAPDVDSIRARFDALEVAEGRESCQVGLVDCHFDLRFVWDIAAHPRLLDAVEAAIGPNIMLLFTHFFCKYPEPEATEAAGKFVAWHQDVTYWGLEPPRAVTAWYAVDDSDRENGCMRVIPATADRARPHGTSGRAGNLLSINQEVSVTPEEAARAVDLPLRAGEISLHDGLAIHGSNPNRSHRRRCGLTIRYIPPSVRITKMNSLGRPWRPILVRGQDEHGHHEPLEPPF